MNLALSGGERNLTSLLSLWPGNPCRIIYASADCKSGSDWMPQGVIAALHLSGRAVQSIGRQNALLSPPPVRLSDQIWAFVYLPMCVCTVTAFVERVGACTIHIPWSAITWLCFLGKGKSILAVAAPLPRTVQSALTNSCWVLLWWIEFFSICADHAIFHYFVLIYGPLFYGSVNAMTLSTLFSVIGETD